MAKHRLRWTSRDLILYGGEEFDVVRSDPYLIFRPDLHGIEPSWGRGTDAYRAVCCDFSVRDGVLHLDLLAVDSKVRSFPAIGGVSPETGAASRERTRHDATYVFEEFRVRYSGVLRIGRDEIRDSRYPTGMEYDVSGFIDPIQFARVLDLTLEDGVVVTVRDISVALGKIRELYRRIEELLERGILTMQDLRAIEKAPGLESAGYLCIGLQAADPDALANRIREISGDRLP